MLLLGVEKDLFNEVIEQFSQKIIYIDSEEFKNEKDTENTFPLNYLEFIKNVITDFSIVYTDFSLEFLQYFNVLNISYKIIYHENINKDILQLFNDLDCEKIVLNEEYSLQTFLSEFDWYISNQEEEQLLLSSEHKMKTLQDLINEDSEMTELDVRDVKELQNKLKMGVLLQAKSMLNRVMKLTEILDKLYDELLNRIERNMETTDTSSLMYTTKFISDALNETNQFIMSLVNNEKIQNFFIIDNSTVINTNSNKLDSDKRERLRRAAEIILNNYDYLVENKLDQIKNPNIIISEDKKGNT